MVRVPFEQLKSEYKRVLVARKMKEENAEILATSYATMAMEGVYSHGVNRFPVFISQVDNGDIDLQATPTKENTIGCIEQWDCHFGPGPLNGMIGVKRSIEIAKEQGMGVVGLKNSNHWMRGGTYALHAAREGYACIAITNSIAIMPAWGGLDHRVGTNPLIISIPGNPPALLDMSCSLYSYGKLEVARLAGKDLPIPGGYNKDGKLSVIPAEIEETKRILPAGYWKGSGLSIVLDMLVTILSGGNSVVEITEDMKAEKGVSQVLITFNTKDTLPNSVMHQKLKRIVDFTLESELMDPDKKVRIPGFDVENYIKEHKENGGIPIAEEIWNAITAL